MRLQINRRPAWLPPKKILQLAARGASLRACGLVCRGQQPSGSDLGQGFGVKLPICLKFPRTSVNDEQRLSYVAWQVFVGSGQLESVSLTYGTRVTTGIGVRQKNKTRQELCW